jgi:hypothetical protein
MRILSLLFALAVAAAMVPGQTLSVPPPQSSSPRFSAPDVKTGDELRMKSRAQIQVVPIDLLVSNNAELQSLRARVAQAEAETDRLEIADPAIREQFSRQLQLLRSLLHLAEMQQADAGKSPTALEVQQHLNNIEGRTRCEACHGRIILKSREESGSLEHWQPDQ